MYNFNITEHFSAKTLDNKHRPIYDALKKYFGISTKGTLLLLATYGLYSENVQYEPSAINNLKESNDTERNSGKILQIRSGTDSEWNNFFNSIILKLAKMDETSFDKTFGDKETYNKYVDTLIDYAHQTAEYFLDNELNSYKKGVTTSNSDKFIQDMLLILKELEEGSPF